MQKFKKLLTPPVIIIVVILVVSFLTFAKKPVSNNPELNLPVSTQTSSTPTPLPFVLAITGIYPNNPNPTIAGGNTAIIIYFNRPLTPEEIKDYKLTAQPEMVFNKRVHINQRSLHFTPAKTWQSNMKYDFDLLYQSQSQKTFSFRPTKPSRSLDGEGTSVPNQSRFPLPRKVVKP